MKKLLTIMLTLVALTASAQGKWEKVVVEADELKGQEAAEVHLYAQPGIGGIVIWDFNKYQFRLISDEHQFNIESGYSQYTGSYAGIEIMVGIYDDSGKMIDKFKLWLDLEDNSGNRHVRTRDAGGMFNPVGQKGKVKKIFKALKSGKGYVRIVTERYETSDYDLKILPLDIE